MGISPVQLAIILLIVVLIFGTKKLRNMGGDLGGAIKNFKKGIKDDEPETNADKVEIADKTEETSHSSEKVDKKES